MRSRFFRRSDGTWLDTVMTTAGRFTVSADIHVAQLQAAAGSVLTAVETEDGSDPRTVIVAITPSPARLSPEDIFREELAAATTLAAVKAALLKRFS